MVPEAPVATMPPSVASAPGIDGEEDALGTQRVVELPARDPGLHADVQVLDRQAQDAVHLAHVDADAALKRDTWPSSDVPAPKGTIGAPWRAQTLTMAAASSVRSADDGVGRRDG